jgi:hypothetical protein
MKRDIKDIPKPFWDRGAKSLKEYWRSKTRERRTHGW